MQCLRWKCCYLWACSLHYGSTCDWINPRGHSGVKMSCWALMFPWLVQLSMHCVFCICPVQVPIKYSAQNKLRGSLNVFYHGEQVNNKYTAVLQHNVAPGVQCVSYILLIAQINFRIFTM